MKNEPISRWRVIRSATPSNESFGPKLRVNRLPIYCFVAALLFVIATFNELGQNHFGSGILLGVIAVMAGAFGIWSLRQG